MITVNFAITIGEFYNECGKSSPVSFYIAI
jgi:hypothetical protein